MNWEPILSFLAEGGMTIAPWIASGVMLVVGTLFYRATGFLPGFARAYVERAYREKESIMRDAITAALRNGITAALARGAAPRDALQEAIDHAIKTNPEGVSHFTQTSNMSRETLAVMAETQAVNLGIKVGADAVVIPTEAKS